jgi:hypothetical protein
MGKVSIALRGWRFEENEVFDENGDLRPLEEMPKATRERIVRLQAVTGQPCDACWLIHGDEHLKRCNVARFVYGEPLDEVILCAVHEPDFVYWFQREGGQEFAGTAEFADRFHEWFLDGGRAPEDFGGMEHVETDPDGVPQPKPDREVPTLEDEIAKLDDEELEALDVDLGDLDV